MAGAALAVVEPVEVVENELPTILGFSSIEELSKADIRQLIADMETIAKTNGEPIEVPVFHHFSKGVYAREMRVPKAALIIGKIHRFENMNVLSQGEVSILSIDGVMRVKAPFTVVASPGAKRAFYMHEDSVWTVFHGTDSKNVDEIEEVFIAKNYDEFVAQEALEAKERSQACLG